MEKRKVNRNTRIVAERNPAKPLINVYLDFSGQKEYVLSRRMDDSLYDLLKDGVAVEDARRWNPDVFKSHSYPGSRWRVYGSKHGRHHSIRDRGAEPYEKMQYLLLAIDEYLLERELYAA